MKLGKRIGKAAPNAVSASAEIAPDENQIAEKQTHSEHTKDRRSFLKTAGAGAIAIAIGAPLAMSVRSCVPNVLYEPPVKFKAGELAKFPEGNTFLREHRVFVFREGKTFHCISARCTHLGCTVQFAKVPDAEGGYEFHCPCHGSKFRNDGANFAGPAPTPLSHFMLDVAADDVQLVVDTSAVTDNVWRLTV